jgi:NAD(P)-dependent dehydrogenase (short-subunit alcohol dehydrogenase family)
MSPGKLQDVHGKSAFITGGASGIGLGIVKALVRAGMRVVVADVRPEGLARASAELAEYGDAIHTILVDVTDRQRMAAVAAEVRDRLGNLHVLCANAGVGDTGYLKDASYGDWDWITSVTLGGVVNCVRSFLPGMREHGEPAHVVATSSMAGLLPVNHGGVYSVAKAAVVGMMEALRMELADTPIGVSVLCPGLTRTGIQQTLALRPNQYRNAQVAAPPGPPTGGSGAPPDFMRQAMDPIEVGEKVLRGIQRNDLYILPHAEFGAMLREHFDAILNAMPPEDPALRSGGPMMPTPYGTALGRD